MKWLGPGLILLCLGCGSAPVQWPGDGVVDVPLAAAWRPERPLVEVSIGGRPPVLFVLDPATSGIQITTKYADALGLAGAGPRRIEGQRLTIGSGELIADLEAVHAKQNAFHERAVVGVLGHSVFVDRVVEINPGSGRVRMTPDAPPHSGERWPINADGAVSLAFGEESADVVLDTRVAVGRLTPATAKQLELPPLFGPDGPIAWGAAVRFPDAGPQPALFAATPAHDLSGYAIFRDRVLQIDSRSPARVVSWPAGGSPIERFADAPKCGKSGFACVRGVVTAVGPGEIKMRFARPEVPLPDRYWARVQVAPHVSVLLQLRPRAGPLRSTLRFSAMTEAHLPQVGDPVRLVDLVLMVRPCPGEVCFVGPRIE